MKLKMVVVDLEISAAQKRLLATLALPAFILGGGAIAYAEVPNIWTGGDTLTADHLNQNFEDLDERLAELVPAGAVMPFDLGACPPGWSPLPEAVGHVVIGAGGPLQVGVAVGTDQVTLGVSQMPAHTHGVTDPGHAHNPSGANTFITAGGVNNAGIGGGSWFNYVNVTSTNVTGISINAEGGGQPFDNRQASLPLLYCKKN